MTNKRDLTNAVKLHSNVKSTAFLLNIIEYMLTAHIHLQPIV